MPLEFSSSEAEAYYQQALAHEDEGEKEQARENYQLAVEIDPLHPELWCRLGLVSPAGEDYIAFDSALRCRALTAEELYWRGRAALAYHHDVDPLRDWAASVALDPRVAYRAIEQHISTFEYGKGRWYPGWEQDQPAPYARQLAFWELQVHCYNLLVARYPTEPEYFRKRAEFYQVHDHLPEAIADYTAAVERDASLLFHERRGKLRLLLHDFAGALQDLTQNRSPYSCWRIHGPHGRSYNRWPQALEALEAAGLAEPTDPMYLKQRFEYYRLKRQHGRALAVVESLIVDEPDRADLRELRIQCHEALPEPNAAALLADYEWLAQVPRPRTREELSAWGVSPDYYDPLDEQCRQLHCCAWAHYRLGNHAAALQCFAAAVDVPTDKEKAPDKRWVGSRSTFWRLPVHDAPYLLWQLQQQMPRNWTTARSHWIASWWMACAIARVPYQLVPNLAEAYEAYLPLSLPTGEHHTAPPDPARYEQALALCAAGVGQADSAYAGLYVALQRNICKSQLRQALNEPTATPASREAALARYDSACAAIGPCAALYT